MSAFGHRVSSSSLSEDDERSGTGPMRHYVHQDGVVTPSEMSFSIDQQELKRALRKARPKRPFIRFITYNIRNAGGNNLNMVLRALNQMHIDFGILTETHLDHEMYTKFCCGYNVLSTKATSRFQGGVALFWRRSSRNWTIEGVKTFGPNVI